MAAPVKTKYKDRPSVGVGSFPTLFSDFIAPDPQAQADIFYRKQHKQAPSVIDFDKNKGEVWFIGHAVLKNGNILNLGEVTEGDGSKLPKYHPDQVFFDAKVQANLKANKENIGRIETDCSLMPCESCAKAVPLFIKDALVLGNKENPIPIHMFSHRNEGSGKTVFVTDTSGKAEYTVKPWEYKD